MAAAVLTPRVRLMAVCDRVRESKTEAGVYHLRGFRRRIIAEAFPFVPSRLWLVALFSSPRTGEFPAYVRVLDDRTDKAVFFTPLTPSPRFEGNDDTFVGLANLRCSFPREGQYTIRIWFYHERGSDVLKGEIPFYVDQNGG